MEDTRRTWPTESTKEDSYGLIETEVAGLGSAGICTKSSMLWLSAWCFSRLCRYGSGAVEHLVNYAKICIFFEFASTNGLDIVNAILT